MKHAPMLRNEAERLASLRALKLLDTPAEERFDRITRLAKSIFDTDIALVSLVDENRQWFKSNQGLNAAETPRDISFCGHAIAQDELFIVNDATSDGRFADNPFVLQYPQIRFYAGAPLTSPDKQRVGTLCIIDSKPRELNALQRTVLRDLADLVEGEMGMLDLKTATDQLLVAKRFCDVSQDLLCLTDIKCCFTYVHPKWSQLLGYNEADLIGKTLFELVHPDDREMTRSALSDLSKEQTTLNFENRCCAKDGTYRWFIWNTTAFLKENTIFASARDITTRKEIEQLKDQLIGIVSHELRTPLTSILGSLQMISQGVAGAVPKEVKELMQIASRSGVRMQRLINDILDIEKIESGKAEFKMSMASLRDAVRDAVTCLDGYGAPRQVQIRLLPGTEKWKAHMDSDRIVQVVTNLVSNAVKFAPEGSCVDVSISEGAQSTRVAVRDYGAGIPEDFKGQIFNKFAQASNRKSGGSGLGLNICKAIVEQHGGKIGFESQSGQGTTFFFELPALSH
jgi:PAS domain S-box-containing protein